MLVEEVGRGHVELLRRFLAGLEHVGGLGARRAGLVQKPRIDAVQRALLARGEPLGAEVEALVGHELGVGIEHRVEQLGLLERLGDGHVRAVMDRRGGVDRIEVLGPRDRFVAERVLRGGVGLGVRQLQERGHQRADPAMRRRVRLVERVGRRPQRLDRLGVVGPLEMKLGRADTPLGQVRVVVGCPFEEEPVAVKRLRGLADPLVRVRGIEQRVGKDRAVLLLALEVGEPRERLGLELAVLGRRVPVELHFLPGLVGRLGELEPRVALQVDRGHDVRPLREVLLEDAGGPDHLVELAELAVDVAQVQQRLGRVLVPRVEGDHAPVRLPRPEVLLLPQVEVADVEQPLGRFRVLGGALGKPLEREDGRLGDRVPLVALVHLLAEPPVRRAFPERGVADERDAPLLAGRLPVVDHLGPGVARLGQVVEHGGRLEQPAIGAARVQALAPVIEQGVTIGPGAHLGEAVPDPLKVGDRVLVASGQVLVLGHLVGADRIVGARELDLLAEARADLLGARVVHARRLGLPRVVASHVHDALEALDRLLEAPVLVEGLAVQVDNLRPQRPDPALVELVRVGLELLVDLLEVRLAPLEQLAALRVARQLVEAPGLAEARVVAELASPAQAEAVEHHALVLVERLGELLVAQAALEPLAPFEIRLADQVLRLVTAPFGERGIVDQHAVLVDRLFPPLEPEEALGDVVAGGDHPPRHVFPRPRVGDLGQVRQLDELAVVRVGFLARSLETGLELRRRLLVAFARADLALELERLVHGDLAQQERAEVARRMVRVVAMKRGDRLSSGRPDLRRRAVLVERLRPVVGRGARLVVRGKLLREDPELARRLVVDAQRQQPVRVLVLLLGSVALCLSKRRVRGTQKSEGEGCGCQALYHHADN